MKKNILITWGLWYIGSHGVVAFEQAGYHTVIVDNLYNSCLATVRNIWKILGYNPDFYELDLRDKKKLEGIFQKYNFDGVLHFAWLKAVWESCEKPLMYFDNNIIGSIVLFECMEKYSVKNIIFSSSATVYNPENIIPFSEKQAVWNTTNPYGTTKFLLEKILEDLAQFSWFNVVNLRYFNPIWAHPSGFIWEDPSWIPNNLLPYIIKVAGKELSQLQVFWWDYDTRDGTWVRDYIDVNDLIQGHLKAYQKLENWKTNGIFSTYNLWIGKGVSVLEMIDLFQHVTGQIIPYVITDRREGDLWEVYCNPEKAKKELWWEAHIPIEESLKNSWKFYNK